MADDRVRAIVLAGDGQQLADCIHVDVGFGEVVRVTPRELVLLAAASSMAPMSVFDAVDSLAPAQQKEATAPGAGAPPVGRWMGFNPQDIVELDSGDGVPLTEIPGGLAIDPNAAALDLMRERVRQAIEKYDPSDTREDEGLIDRLRRVLAYWAEG